MNRKVKIGAHVSVAGGLHKGIENATDIGAESIQIFGSSPRRWQVEIPDEAEIKKYKEALQKSNVGAVYLHAPYLVNLASVDEDMHKKSVKNLVGQLKISDLMGANGVIFHIGSGRKNISKKEAIQKSIKSIKEVLKNSPNNSILVMENTAGGRQKIGASAEELGFIFKNVKSSRLKICFDTAHAFEAGLINKYSSTNIKNLFNKWHKEIGIKNIVALHINDSKTTFESHHDRHENIGKGYIGIVGFKNLAKEKRLADKAWILEVPGFDDNGPDKKNIQILKSCF